MNFENITFIEFLLFFSNFIKFRNIRKCKLLFKYLFCRPCTLPPLDSAVPGWLHHSPPFSHPVKPLFIRIKFLVLQNLNLWFSKALIRNKQYTSKDYTETGCTNEWDCNSQLHPFAWILTAKFLRHMICSCLL